MDLNNFIYGHLLLLIGLLMLIIARKEKNPLTQDTHVKGMTSAAFIKFWGAAIMLTIVGIVLIIKSIL